MTRKETATAVALLAAAAIIACWCTLPLIWDGGYQMSVSLITQEPYAYLSRFHTSILWLPLVKLSQITDNVTALIFAYGLPFLIAPALSVGLSVWVVRRHAPGLAVWALFGVAVSMSGQAFVINDSIWQQTLFWPILLGALVPLDWRRRVVLLVLAVFQFPHQLGAMLLGMATVAAWMIARRRGGREAWGKVLALGLLTLLAGAKIVLVSLPTFLGGRFYDSYAAQQADFGAAAIAFVTGVCGLPLIGLCCLCFVGWKIARDSQPLSQRTWHVLLIAVAVWVLWACLPWHWAGAINYRRWVGPVAAPFCLLATLDALRSPAHGSPDRGRVAMTLAGLFFAVLTIQSLTWACFIREFRAAAAAVPGVVVRKSQVPGMKWSQLDHWGITSTYIVLQGREPRKYFAYTDACIPPLTALPPSIPLWEPHLIPAAPGTMGYYDHRPMLRELARENGAASR